MKTQTLIQLLALVAVASVTAQFIAGQQSFGRSVIAGRDYSVILVDNDSSNRGFHAVGSSSGDICNFHEILVPGGSKIPDYLFFLLDYFLPQILGRPLAPYPNSSELNAFKILLILIFLVDVHELVDVFVLIFQLVFFENIEAERGS